ncbi:MAG TPA: uroporphyrinogen decarboxylase family protein [Armatimonadota bacterium]|nr:uroporphyrinogen decarboxylase family protein [Armatimonadota bacterium]
MTHRERLLATLRFEPVDRVPDYEFGAWEQTINRWEQEGLPAGLGGVWGSIQCYFHTDEKDFGPTLGINIALFPAFERKVLEEKGDHVIVQDLDGAVSEMMKPELGASIPRYLRHALETRADWELIRDERLNPDTPGRIPDDIDDRCRRTLDADYPVAANCGSVYGLLRNWMGVENISIAIAEDPEWVAEMITHLTELKLSVYERVAGKCRLDLGWWWEDMCYKKGPLVSPRWFQQYAVPQCKRTTEFLRRECGCEFHMVDCDGNIHQLVPAWIEGGVSVMFPLEAAHTDAYKIREQFGVRAPLRGGFDKRALAAGKEAIDREFDRLRPLLAGGGFIPHTDHLVPPDVSWEDFVYYRERKCEFIGKEPIPYTE